jgi:hypothetical protein
MRRISRLAAFPRWRATVLIGYGDIRAQDAEGPGSP